MDEVIELVFEGSEGVLVMTERAPDLLRVLDGLQLVNQARDFIQTLLNGLINFFLFIL